MTYIVARTVGEPFGYARSALQAIQSADPDLAPLRTLTMDELVSSSLGRRSLLTLLMTVFAVAAVALAVVGVYDLVTYSVLQQVREIGVRLALGANRGDIRSMVLSRSAKLTMTGIAIGFVAAAGLTRYMDSLLFGVTAHDPAAFAAAAALLGLTALGASYIPARRAMAVDPMAALRDE